MREPYARWREIYEGLIIPQAKAEQPESALEIVQFCYRTNEGAGGTISALRLSAHSQRRSLAATLAAVTPPAPDVTRFRGG